MIRKSVDVDIYYYSKCYIKNSKDLIDSRLE